MSVSLSKLINLNKQTNKQIRRYSQKASSETRLHEVLAPSSKMQYPLQSNTLCGTVSPWVEWKGVEADVALLTVTLSDPSTEFVLSLPQLWGCGRGVVPKGVKEQGSLKL